MRTALAVCVCLSLLFGCASRPGFSWPESIAGGWQRAGAEEVGGEAPEVIQQLGLKSVRKARYQRGGSMVEAAAYEMTSSAGAFEASQKWRPEPGKLAFQAGDWFVVLTGPELQALAGEVDKLFKR